MYTAEKGVNYQAEVAIRVAQARGRAGRITLAGPLKMHVAAAPPDKRARDLDNLMKALQDALQNAGVYFSDSQIDDLHIIRMPAKRDGGVHVTITEITTTEEHAPC